MTTTRRDAFTLFGAGALGLAAASPASAQTQTPSARGVEGQRRPDLGDGRFLNPLLAGDRPDPTILKDGDVWYMTFSSFEAIPGLVIWRSEDLINWTPITAALNRNIGSVWAPELIRHEGRYFLYIPARTPEARTIWVSWADRIEGPWSEPIDLHLPEHIDPGHAVGEDGKRYLFLSGGDRVPLSDDGLSTTGPVEHVYDPWRYPVEWDVESFSPEGPKILARDGWFYMITAVGGTAGPPTGHMVIMARSRSIHGPWEDHPQNPVVRTRSRDEQWWSRGHATLVEGPGGGWWMVYHGYENGYWTLGRQCLLDPVRWRADGWPEATGGDLSQPIRKPDPSSIGDHGAALSDDFAGQRLGVQWSFHDAGPNEASRVRVGDGTLRLAAKGASPRDASPLLVVQGEQAYQFEVEIEIDPGAVAGVVLFYDSQLYCGLGFDADRFVTHQFGLERGRPDNPHGRRMWLRLTNDRHIVTFHHSADGETWAKFDRQMEVSGYHHNVRGGFMSLRPGFYSAGTGEARFRRFRYRALT